GLGLETVAGDQSEQDAVAAAGEAVHRVDDRVGAARPPPVGDQVEDGERPIGAHAAGLARGAPRAISSSYSARRRVIAAASENRPSTMARAAAARASAAPGSSSTRAIPAASAGADWRWTRSPGAPAPTTPRTPPR